MRVRNPLAAGRGLVAGLLLLGAIGLAAWAREVASEEWPATAPAQNRPATAADPGLEDDPAGPPSGEVSLGSLGAAVATRSDSARPAENVPSTAPWPPGIRAIKERGRLVVAIVDRERYPFFFSAADGNLAGSDVDMARDLAASWALRLRSTARPLPSTPRWTWSRIGEPTWPSPS